MSNRFFVSAATLMMLSVGLPLILSACGKRESDEERRARTPLVNQFPKPADCSFPRDQLLFCESLVTINIGKTVLKIPRNYLDEWYVYPDPEKNYALVYASWPSLQGRKYPKASFAVQDSVKIVFQFRKSDRFIGLSETFDSHYGGHSGPREDLAQLGLWNYSRGNFFFPKEEKIPISDRAILAFQCDSPWSCPSDDPTCDCRSYLPVGQDAYAKIEFHPKHLRDWKELHNKVQSMINKFVEAY